MKTPSLSLLYQLNGKTKKWLHQNTRQTTLRERVGMKEGPEPNREKLILRKRLGGYEQG